MIINKKIIYVFVFILCILSVFYIIISCKSKGNLSELQWTKEKEKIIYGDYAKDNVRIVGDGEDGGIIIWSDRRNEDNAGIYAQRLNSDGKKQWGKGDIQICKLYNLPRNIEVTKCKTGGAIIAWNDDRAGNIDVYANKIDLSGKILWKKNGNPICSLKSNQSILIAEEDGYGGAFFVWDDERNGNNDIYAQKIDSKGKIQWKLNGIPIGTTDKPQLEAKAMNDGKKGMIIVWVDERHSNGEIYNHICAQRIDMNGSIQWKEGGIEICSSKGLQSGPQIVHDDTDGAIIIWADTKNGSWDIYAQKIDSEGKIKWNKEEVNICTAPESQLHAKAISDGKGGAIITWIDERSKISNVYIQKVDSNGTIQWKLDGLYVCDENHQTNPCIINDGYGGAIIAWEDGRDEKNNCDIYAQWIDSDGNFKGKENGNEICINSAWQYRPQIINNKIDEFIILWLDTRFHSNVEMNDIFAQKINILK